MCVCVNLENRKSVNEDDAGVFISSIFPTLCPDFFPPSSFCHDVIVSLCALNLRDILHIIVLYIL